MSPYLPTRRLIGTGPAKLNMHRIFISHRSALSAYTCHRHFGITSDESSPSHNQRRRHPSHKPGIPPPRLCVIGFRRDLYDESAPQVARGHVQALGSWDRGQGFGRIRVACRVSSELSCLQHGELPEWLQPASTPANLSWRSPARSYWHVARPSLRAPWAASA